MAATVDTRSPVPTFRLTPVVRHSPIVPTFRRTTVVQNSPISHKVYGDVLSAEKNSFQSHSVQHNASKITKLGSQPDKISDKQNEKRKVTAKRLPSKKEDKDAEKKRSKKSKSTDMPKRPATAFILFMSSVKEELKKQNPDIKTAVMLSKSAGTKWKSMAQEEKLPYIKLAAEEKTAYQTKLESYKSKQSTELDKEKHAACGGSEPSLLQSTDLNILEVVEDNGIDMQ